MRSTPLFSFVAPLLEAFYPPSPLFESECFQGVRRELVPLVSCAYWGRFSSSPTILRSQGWSRYTRSPRVYGLASYRESRAYVHYTPPGLSLEIDTGTPGTG